VAFDFDQNGALEASDGYFAGRRFAYGIASKTSVLKTDKGYNYGYTSGTDNSAAGGAGGGMGVPIDKSLLPGSTPPVTGARQSWIELIND